MDKKKKKIEKMNNDKKERRRHFIDFWLWLQSMGGVFFIGLKTLNKIVFQCGIKLAEVARSELRDDDD